MVAATEALLRILCADPDDGDTLLSSAQYTSIITIESDVYRAAALACRSIAGTFAEKVDTEVGDISVELQQKYEHFIDLADKYDLRAKEGGGGGATISPEFAGVSISGMESVESDTDRVDSSFKIGMHGNGNSSTSEARNRRNESELIA